MLPVHGANPRQFQSLRVDHSTQDARIPTPIDTQSNKHRRLGPPVDPNSYPAFRHSHCDHPPTTLRHVHTHHHSIPIRTDAEPYMSLANEYWEDQLLPMLYSNGGPVVMVQVGSPSLKKEHSTHTHTHAHTAPHHTTRTHARMFTRLTHSGICAG
jgi:hypothetical protein